MRYMILIRSNAAAETVWTDGGAAVDRKRRRHPSARDNVGPPRSRGRATAPPGTNDSER